jgi:tetraacyldisaccharide-1-P 4'-kinase
MKPPSSARRLLVPLIPLYRLALDFRELRLLMGLEPVRRLRFPVVSIGNLSTGGAGKTPLTIALAKALKRRGLRVDVLSRGYGRQSLLAARVQPGGRAEEFGDEPLLIAREAKIPVYVAPERYDAGLLAEADAEAKPPASKPQPAAQEQAAAGPEAQNSAEQPETAPATTAPEPDPGQPLADSSETGAETGAETDQDELQPAHSAPGASPAAESASDSPSSATGPTAAPPPSRHVHLLDDGFQHRQLDRDVEILLLSQQDWQDWLLPAGNLREPRAAIRRASVIALPANQPELEAALSVWGWQGPVWRLHRKMEIPLVKSPVAAFCGIARPEQYFAGLEAAGLEVALQLAFPDHFTYTREVLEELLAEAQEKECTAIVTTGKDLVRLGKLASIFPDSLPLVSARLCIEIENESAALDWLAGRIAQHPPR